jgi:glycosyltransferase involved in cell wall biosynthesis
MHICFITHEYPKKGIAHGGIGTFVQTLAQEIVLKGHQVSVIGLNNLQKNEYEEDLGVFVYRIKRSKLKTVGTLINAYRINKKIRNINAKTPIDILESNENGLALIKKIKNIIYIIRMHGGHHYFSLYENRPRQIKKVLLEKFSFKKADHLVAVSQFVADITLKELNIKNEVTVIYNPVNTRKFNQVDYSKAIPNSLLFVGTICEKKGIRQLLEAMPIVKKEIPNVTLKVVGRDWFFPDGTSYVKYLKSHINSEILSCVEFVGVIPNTEIPSYIEKAEICVYPSHMEAMPLAWLEVLSMGKQFVGSDIGPGHEAVNNTRTGILCNPYEPEDIAEKIIWMLENKENAIVMGKNARKDMLDRFNINTIVNTNLLFYKKVI